MRPRGLFVSFLALAAPMAAQVPDGYYVFGSFVGVPGAAGQCGIFFCHPRDPAATFIPVTNLPAALAAHPTGRRGTASLLRRPSDGSLIVGERAPLGTSVDVHLLKLSGANVVFAQLFSVGTSANVGEVPQMALLPDGRVVVAATDLTAGSPLAQFQTLGFNWEGIGILDMKSGGVVPISIPNLNQFPGVINGLALSPDGNTIYVGNWISAASGDVWSVPVAGGPATQIATLPWGASNVAIDLDGSILVTTLDGPPNLFRIGASPPHTVTPIATTTGPMNAIALETVTGHYVVATANAGVPPRSIAWMSPTGVHTLLLSPFQATISSVDVNPNPESYGAATAGVSNYAWQLRPNAGGLPLQGSASFRLTMDAASGEPLWHYFMIGTATLPGVPLLGMNLHVDPGSAFHGNLAFSTGGPVIEPLPLPVDPSMTGIALRGQMLVYELSTSAYAASPGVEFTLL